MWGGKNGRGFNPKCQEKGEYNAIQIHWEYQSCNQWYRKEEYKAKSQTENSNHCPCSFLQERSSSILHGAMHWHSHGTDAT